MVCHDCVVEKYVEDPGAVCPGCASPNGFFRYLFFSLCKNERGDVEAFCGKTGDLEDLKKHNYEYTCPECCDRVDFIKNDVIHSFKIRTTELMRKLEQTSKRNSKRNSKRKVEEVSEGLQDAAVTSKDTPAETIDLTEEEVDSLENTRNVRQKIVHVE